MKISAIVPIKLKSRRLPNKNFLILGDKILSNYIFETLLSCKRIDEVYCYCSSDKVLELLPDGINHLPRPQYLDDDLVQANELFRYPIEKIKSDLIIICHASGPFISKGSIEKGIDAILLEEFDCSFSVEKHSTYSWYLDKPLNYSQSNTEQTQFLNPVWTETSGFYCFRRKDYLKTNSRINGKPFFVEVNKREAIDIDEASDFNLATQLLNFDPDKNSFNETNFFINYAKDKYKVDHICFDLDGCLIDSISLMEIAWEEAMRKSGELISFESYKKLIGLPFFTILDQLNIERSKHTEIKNYYDIICTENISKITVFDGAEKSLKELKSAGFKLSIATSKTRVRTNQILDTFFPKITFDSITTPENVRRGKPYPDQLLLACLETGSEPRSTVFVGDMEVDRKAANRAGTRFIFAKWGYGNIENHKLPWFISMSDLVNFLITNDTNQPTKI